MQYCLIKLGQTLLAAGIVLFVPLSHAQLAIAYFDEFPWNPVLARGPAPDGPMPPSRVGDAFWDPHELAGPGDATPALPMLRGLSLTEAQRDEVFAILHAQAPALREKEKAARRAHDDLRDLAVSSGYDNAKAKALADAGARAQGDVALRRAEAEHRIYALLTEEQREQLEMIQRPRRRP